MNLNYSIQHYHYQKQKVHEQLMHFYFPVNIDKQLGLYIVI